MRLSKRQLNRYIRGILLRRINENVDDTFPPLGADNTIPPLSSPASQQGVATQQVFDKPEDEVSIKRRVYERFRKDINEDLEPIKLMPVNDSGIGGHTPMDRMQIRRPRLSAVRVAENIKAGYFEDIEKLKKNIRFGVKKNLLGKTATLSSMLFEIRELERISEATHVIYNIIYTDEEGVFSPPQAGSHYATLVAQIAYLLVMDPVGSEADINTFSKRLQPLEMVHNVIFGDQSILHEPIKTT